MLTAFLAMVMYQMEIRTALPRVPYVTFVETYLMVYTCMCGFACLEYVWVVTHFRDDGAYDKILHLYVDWFYFGRISKPACSSTKLTYLFCSRLAG